MSSPHYNIYKQIYEFVKINITLLTKHLQINLSF